MEPRGEEQQKAMEPGAERKPKRFRIVKLEERIAPRRGGGTKMHACATAGATCIDTCNCLTCVCITETVC